MKIKKVLLKILATSFLVAGTVLMPGGSVNAAGVAINENNFPDAVFRSYVQTNCDINSNGYLEEEEIQAVEQINVFGTYSSLQGVEYFTSLKKLGCGNGQSDLTELNLSHNAQLEELDCASNSLTTLDLSHNTKLKKLWCDFNPLITLDLSHNTQLEELWCESCQLTTAVLDISNCNALKMAVLMGEKHPYEDRYEYVYYVEYGNDDYDSYYLGVDQSVTLITDGSASQPTSPVVDNTDYSAVFDADFYYNTYEDLRTYIGNDPDALLAHFVAGGMAEGRQGNAEFHVQVYQSKYEEKSYSEFILRR